MRYFVEIMRMVLLKDAGLDLVWPRMAVLAAFGIAILTIASLRFSKRAA